MKIKSPIITLHKDKNGIYKIKNNKKIEYKSVKPTFKSAQKPNKEMLKLKTGTLLDIII